MNEALPLFEFGLALLIGALVGLERQKQQTQEEASGLAGLRTFMLIAEAGAVAAWLAEIYASPVIFAAALLGAAGVIIAGYRAHVRHDPSSMGLTTEVAAVVVFLLGGAVVVGPPALPVALGIATSAVLAFKQPLHGVVDRLGTSDIYAGLKLLIAIFIVLPLLPDRPVDPWGALNPYRMGLLVILISALSLVGYVATRLLGPARGLALTGLSGGLVSSTAVTLALSRRSQDEGRDSALGSALATGLLLAWTVMFVRIGVAVAVVYTPLLSRLLWPLVGMTAVGGLGALLVARAGRRVSKARAAEAVDLHNPFSLTSAMKFAALFTTVMLIVRIVETSVAAEGLYFVAALAGLTDVDAITLSMANYAKGGGDLALAARAITIAALTNTLVKCGIVVVLGTAALRRPVVTTTVVMFLAAALLLILT